MRRTLTTQIDFTAKTRELEETDFNWNHRGDIPHCRLDVKGATVRRVPEFVHRSGLPQLALAGWAVEELLLAQQSK